MRDVRLAFRQFRKSPGFTITVILTIALGIGADTAIFTLVHSVLMKSLPVAEPKTLYRIGDRDDCCVNGGFMNDDGNFAISRINCTGISLNMLGTFHNRYCRNGQCGSADDSINGGCVRNRP